MGRNLKQIITELPPERQQRIEDRYQELKQKVEGGILAALRRSPLVGADLNLSRSHEEGRKVDL
jgi:hypothetical protein